MSQQMVDHNGLPASEILLEQLFGGGLIKNGGLPLLQLINDVLLAESPGFLHLRGAQVLEQRNELRGQRLQPLTLDQSTLEPLLSLTEGP